jgi:hypothetical protein
MFARKVRGKVRGIVSRLRLAGKRPVQIIICGYPRSGTSLFYNMLAATAKKFQFEEYENNYRKYLVRDGNWISKRPLDVLELAQRPPDNPLCKRIYVIVLRRDVRDILTSIHPRVPGKYFIGYDGCYSGPGPNGEPPAYKYAGIKEVDQAVEALKSRGDIDLVFVRYEELIADPDRVQSYLGKRLGVRFSARFSEFNQCPEKLAFRYEGQYAPLDASLVREHKSPDASRIMKWRASEHRDRIRDQFTKYPELFGLLIRDGYESNKSWFEAYGESAPTDGSAQADAAVK